MNKYKTIKEYMENGSIEKFINDYKISIESLYTDNIIKLASEGWTIPPFINWHKTLDELNKDHERLIKHWISLYHKNESVLLNKIVSNCPEKWRFLLKECVDCYFDERYRICIPALISMFEGLLSYKIFDFNVVNIRYTQPLENNINGNNYTGIDVILAISLKEFTKHIFKNSFFSNDEPVDINRHWIAHGRSSVNVNKIDVIKLFNAIATTLWLSNSWAEIVCNDKAYNK